MIEPFMQETIEWFTDLRATFWEATLQDQTLKVLKEATEFAESPSLEEAADVLITLLGSMYLAGWTIDDLARALHHKNQINATRTWARQDDGTYQHRV